MLHTSADADNQPQAQAVYADVHVPLALEIEHRQFLSAYNALSACLRAIPESNGYVSAYRVRDLLEESVKNAYARGLSAFLEAHREGQVSPTIDDAAICRQFCRDISDAGPIGAYRLLQATFGAGMQDKLLRDTVRTVIREFDLRSADAMKVRSGHVVLSSSMYLDHISKQMGKVEYDYRCVERFHQAIHALLDLLVRTAPPAVANQLRGGVHGLARHSVTPQMINQLHKPPLKFRGYQGKVEIMVPVELADGLANLLSIHGDPDA